MRTFFTILLAFTFIFLKTATAQSGWYWQNPLPQGNPLYAISFNDAMTGTAVGKDGTILRTTDGGSTWSQQNSGTTRILEAVSFSDVNTGTVVGSSGTILRTTDGGSTWNQQNSGVTSNFILGVSFANANTGIAVGSFGLIRITNNGGANWTQQNSGTTTVSMRFPLATPLPQPP